MQNIFATIVLTLAFTSTFATFLTKNYAKAPIQVANDSDVNFTNSSAGVTLASVNTRDIHLVSSNLTKNTENSSLSLWNVWTRKLDPKTLTPGANSNFIFTNPLSIFYSNNYAVALTLENVNGIFQLIASQKPLNGDVPLPRLTLSNNSNNSWYPQSIGTVIIRKTCYVFYLAQSGKVNVTNFVIGGSVGTGEFTLTSTYSALLSVAWGEALGTSQIYAIWIEGNYVLKEALIDVRKGPIRRADIAGYYRTYNCIAFSTDKKIYGTLCSQYWWYYPNRTTAYFIKTDSSPGLALFANYTTNTSSLVGVYPYGPYITLIFQDTVSVLQSNYNYQIWNLDSFTPFKNGTPFLEIDYKSKNSFFRSPSGGLYTLLYNHQIDWNATLTSVSVGLLLDSYDTVDRYISSIFS